jgi:coenzyme F420-reducing hydrogenase delta subunit
MCSGRVKPDFVWHAFQKGAPVVLVSGCHYADCHYIDANRQTVRRVDALWEGLEKHGVRPERLQLEWCSAAEGQRWAQIMREVEELRAAIEVQEVERTREDLQDRKPPRVSKVGRLKEPTRVTMQCLRCGNEWNVVYNPSEAGERMCSACRSSSVRIILNGRE